MDFQYPDMYHRPPFFTLQRVQDTRERQIQMWIELITNYQRASGNNILHVESDLKDDSIFCNHSINRKLNAEAIRVILNAVVDQGYGMWEDESHTTCITSWKKFPDWATALYEWARDTYSMNKIMTLYEISTADITAGEEFHGIDSLILLQAVQLLRTQGKASLILADSPDETGVKFLE